MEAADRLARRVANLPEKAERRPSSPLKFSRGRGRITSRAAMEAGLPLEAYRRADDGARQRMHKKNSRATGRDGGNVFSFFRQGARTTS